jgi:protein-disulfide isomerase
MRVALILLVFLFVAPLFAQTPDCDSLTSEQKKVVASVFASEHPYDGCDGTFEECLKEKSVHPLVRRLASWICRKAKAGQNASQISQSLRRRALSMMKQGTKYTIDTSRAIVVGSESAPVKVAMYVCARCPYCSKLVPLLYKEVMSGRLRNIAVVYIKLFPIKAHEHSAEANMAVASAASLGKGIEYLLKVYENFDNFSVDALSCYASAVGLDRTLFEAKMKDVRDIVVESKKEGIRNTVDATPTIFISGRKWQGDLDIDTVVDAILEEQGL